MSLNRRLTSPMQFEALVRICAYLDQYGVILRERGAALLFDEIAISNENARMVGNHPGVVENVEVLV